MDKIIEVAKATGAQVSLQLIMENTTYTLLLRQYIQGMVSCPRIIYLPTSYKHLG